MAKIIVGIDFGTSTTVVRWRKEDSDEIHVIKDINSNSIIDTAIFIPQDSDEWLYGHSALTQRNRQGESIRNFKMNLIDSETECQAEIYVRKFMEHIYRLFTKDTMGINYDSMDIYVSYPVKWPTEKKILMKNIISDTGFGKGNGVSIFGKTEPDAAASELMRINISNLIHYSILKTDVPLNVMMLDMGAGTSDLLLFQLMLTSCGEIIIPEDKVVQYPVSKQPFNCGGREIDEAMSKDILSYLSRGMGKPVKEKWFDIEMAKNWKDQTLSEQLKYAPVADAPSAITAIIEQAEEYGQWDKTIEKYRMSRNKFETLTEAHWNNLYKLINNGVAKFKHECNIGAEDIDIIFLTGGHSQWYCVPQLFNGKGINGTIATISLGDSLKFTKILSDPQMRILQGRKPQETVANGLCWPNFLKIPNIAENNVWIRFGVNDEYTYFYKFINKGDLLPKEIFLGKDTDWEKVDIDYDEEDIDYDEEDIISRMLKERKYTPFYSIEFEKDLFMDSHKFDLCIEIREGSDLSTASISKFEVFYNGQKMNVIIKIILAILSLPIPQKLTRIKRKFVFSSKVGFAKDQTLIISGNIKLKGKEIAKFNEKNLKIL